MTVKDIGEFKLIERFSNKLKTDSTVVKGSGDDCAVLKLDARSYQLLTCDMLVEGIDFTPKIDPYLVGRKSIAVSISDIAACSGQPRYCVVSMGIPKKTSVKLLDRLFKGMLDIAKEFKINIVGGDISQSPKITIDVSMLGRVEKKNLTLRSSARSGDLIFVTGSLGGSISGKHLKFIPRINEARFLAKEFKVNAMIDISDGLSQDLAHILKQSKVGAIIYEDLIPMDEKSTSLSDALNSGEDFELLFTMSRKIAKRLLKRNLVNFKPIGEIVGEKYGFTLINKDGKPIKISPKGYRHF
ncbi:MAG: thiamine-phosphate kinase [Candidatus Omnitrophica bacterium]|nr:thiamine-phosphate kinase [Candidatus Omnitrophota bacterium]